MVELSSSQVVGVYCSVLLNFFLLAALAIIMFGSEKYQTSLAIVKKHKAEQAQLKKERLRLDGYN